MKWAEPDRLVVVRDGAVVVALELVDAAAIVVGAGIGRVDADRVVEIVQRRVELALLGQLMAADA